MQTGYSIDSSGYIQGPSRGGQYYLVSNYIYGPNCQGSFWVDSSGSVCDHNGQTDFMIRGGYIWGPSAQLPWF